ncbi:polygalacturonase inhibitor 2-like [Carex rostrata]
MSSIFFLLLLSFTASSVLSTKDDEIALLKIKKQLGNPDGLRWWVKGFDFCDINANEVPQNSFITCTSTGRVRTLQFENLAITTSFPDAICSLTEIDFLQISNIPGFYGSIPSCITKLSNLRTLNIFDTSLSGPVPSFYNHTNMIGIYLARNHLSGTIPPSLSTLPNLAYLELPSNYLTGTIPPGIFHRSSHTLDLSNNSLTGEIPKCYGLVDFWIILLANNRLSGDASVLFGKDKMTGKIDLANNDLEFDLSHVEFSNNLYEFDLSHNKIYGKVPNSLATAAGLYFPNLSFNKLCGELPQGGNMWRFNAAFFADNACLCGNPLPSCSILAPAPAFASEPPF